MAGIGVFSDSSGDLGAFDAALRLLVAKGARRFHFAGGRFEDLDDWARGKRSEGKAQADYTNLDFLEDVSRHLLGLEQLERPPAFGSSWESARAVEDLARLKDRVLRAPEKGCRAWNDPSVPRKVMDLVGDALCCVVHDKNDLDKEDLMNATVLIHGMSPEPRVVQIGARTFVTPGRLSGAARATVGLLELQDRQLTFSAYALGGETVLEPQVLATPTRARVSVR
jgi:hypothetical protein